MQPALCFVLRALYCMAVVIVMILLDDQCTSVISGFIVTEGEKKEVGWW